MNNYQALRTQPTCKMQLTETGFPSPAADHRERALSLDELLINHPAATFYVRAEGNSMQKSGIFDGDLLVVDRALNARDKDIIIAAVGDDTMIRRLILRGQEVWLASDQADHVPMRIHRQTDWVIWGVVTHVIHNVQPEAR